MEKKIYFFLMLLCLPGILSGCKSDREGGEKEVQVTIEDYQKRAYLTTDVKYGTIEPVLTLELTPYELESNSYSFRQ